MFDSSVDKYIEKKFWVKKLTETLKHKPVKLVILVFFKKLCFVWEIKLKCNSTA